MKKQIDRLVYPLGFAAFSKRQRLKELYGLTEEK